MPADMTMHVSKGDAGTGGAMRVVSEGNEAGFTPTTRQKTEIDIGMSCQWGSISQVELWAR